ncbi:MAG: hypothetical protein ACP5G5_07250 [Thermoplasmata archaeon]
MNPWKRLMISAGIYSIVLLLLLSPVQPVSGSSLTAGLRYSSTLMDVGQSQVLSVNVTGGVPPYSYQWYINGNVLGVSSASYTFQPASTGNFTFYVKVTDSQGSSAVTNSVNITVNPTLGIVTQPKSYVTDQNYYSHFSVVLSGGSPSFVYYWHVMLSTLTLNVTTVSSSSRSCNFTYIPSVSGNLTVFVSVRDSANATVISSKVYLLVNPTPSPYLAPGNAIAVPANVTQSFFGYVSGGTPPFTFTWYVNGTKFTNLSSYFNHSFAPGRYSVYYVVNDSIGYTSSSAIATVYATTAPLPSVSYSATPPSNLTINRNMTVDLSARSQVSNITWVVDDVVTATGQNFSYVPSSYGIHTFYAQVPYRLNGVNVSVPGAFWVVNVSSVPYHLILTPAMSQVDAGNYIYLTADALLQGLPATLYSVLSVNGSLSYYSLILYSGRANVTIPVPPNVTGRATLSVFCGLSSNLSFVRVHSNVLSLQVNPQPSGASVSVAVVSQGSSYALVRFTGSFSGGTGPYSYSWSINGTGFTGQSFVANLSFGVYSVKFAVKDYYGYVSQNLSTLYLYPPVSVIKRISGINNYSGVFYLNSSSMRVSVVATSYHPISSLDYTFYYRSTGTNLTYVSSGSVPGYSSVAVINITGGREYLYSFNFTLSIPKEGSFQITLSTVDVLGLGSTVSFPVVYSTSVPVIGRILPSLVLTSSQLRLYLDNISAQVPITKVAVNVSMPGGLFIFYPPFTNVTITLPGISSFYNVTVVVYQANGLTASQSYRIYLDLSGIRFTASVVSYNGNEVVISLSPAVTGGVTPVFYRVSTTGDFSGSVWKPFMSSISVPVNSGSGTIYIQVMDSAGVITQYSVKYALPAPLYIQYLWLIVSLPLALVFLIILSYALRSHRRRVISSRFGSVDLSTVEQSQKERYFMEELAREGSPRLKDFRRLLKSKYGITDRDFDSLVSSLAEKKKIMVATDEEKKARIYPVLQEPEPQSPPGSLEGQGPDAGAGSGGPPPS